MYLRWFSTFKYEQNDCFLTLNIHKKQMFYFHNYVPSIFKLKLLKKNVKVNYVVSVHLESEVSVDIILLTFMIKQN